MSTVNDHNEGSNDFTVGDVWDMAKLTLHFQLNTVLPPSESLKRFALTSNGQTDDVIINKIRTSQYPQDTMRAFNALFNARALHHGRF